MEVVECAARFAELQAYGAQRAAETAVTYDQAVEVVHRVLKQR